MKLYCSCYEGKMVHVDHFVGCPTHSSSYWCGRCRPLSLEMGDRRLKIWMLLLDKLDSCYFFFFFPCVRGFCSFFFCLIFTRSFVWLDFERVSLFNLFICQSLEIVWVSPTWNCMTLKESLLSIFLSVSYLYCLEFSAKQEKLN